MYHVALVNFTDRKILHAEKYAKHEDAIFRIRGLEVQAALNARDLKGEWSAYGPAEEPFAFPVDAKPEKK